MLVACAAFALLFDCDAPRPSPVVTTTAGAGAGAGAGAKATTPSDDGNVIATVNGTPIREVDVLYKLKSDSHQKEMRPEYRKNLLDGVIREQLEYERALELGLDSDPKYQEEVRRLEAQLNAVKRKSLGEVFFQKEIAAKAKVSDAEVRRYFDDHKEWFRTDLHLLQILRRSESSIQDAQRALTKGVPFEDVARGDEPQAQQPQQAQQAQQAQQHKPWDLGYVKLAQVPTPWQKAAETLKVGETSGILRGPKDRFWIIKLVARREGPEVSFNAIEPALASRLTAARIEELREKTDRELHDRARIEYTTSPATTAPTP